MSRNILITGASGYLGGSMLSRLGGAGLPPYDKLYALVRTEEQADAVRKYGAESLKFNVNDEAAVRETIIEKRISVVFWLIDAMSSTVQVNMIKALKEVKTQMGLEVHLLHTSGAKIFSSHAGAPTDRPLLDNEPGLYEIQKSQVPPIGAVQFAIDVNNTVIDEAEAHGVRSYIFAPCVVYGKGEGFGNPISIQTVAIVRAALAAGRVYRTDDDRPTWPVSHLTDNTNLYLQLLRKILAEEDLDYGRNGYYLAAAGSVAWDDIYGAMAKALAKRGALNDATVSLADEPALEKMAVALQCEVPQVALQLGGRCTFTAEHGKQFGWEPAYKPDHILEDADAEVERILQYIG